MRQEHTEPESAPRLTDPTDPRLSPPPVEWGVEVVGKAISTVAHRWRHRSFPPPAFDYPGPPPHLRDGPWFDYCALAVSVLACLWPPAGAATWSTTLDRRSLNDAPALFAAVTKWMGPGSVPDLSRFTDMTPGRARRLFAGRGVLQMIPRRGDRLAAVAATLTTRWDGATLSLVEEAGWDGPEAVRLLAETVPGYEDEAQVDGYRIRFRKLAHLAAALMASRSSRPWSGLETFPVYADYMVPKHLRHLGVIRYSPELSETVDSRREIPRHSRPEIAIRWATVRAGQLLVEELNRSGAPVDGPRLDYFLWSEAALGSNSRRMGRHHRTVTLDY